MAYEVLYTVPGVDETERVLTPDQAAEKLSNLTLMIVHAVEREIEGAGVVWHSRESVRGRL